MLIPKIKTQSILCNSQYSFCILCLRKTWEEKSHIIVASSFSKSSLFKMFSIHPKTQGQCSQIPSVYKEILKKLPFCDGLVWTGLAIEPTGKDTFSNFSSVHTVV